MKKINDLAKTPLRKNRFIKIIILIFVLDKAQLTGSIFQV